MTLDLRRFQTTITDEQTNGQTYRQTDNANATVALQLKTYFFSKRHYKPEGLTQN